MGCLQHPDLVEKRRKAFGDNLRTYLVAAQQRKAALAAQSDGAPANGPVLGAKDGDPDSEADMDGSSMRRRTAPS